MTTTTKILAAAFGFGLLTATPAFADTFAHHEHVRAMCVADAQIPIMWFTTTRENLVAEIDQLPRGDSKQYRALNNDFRALVNRQYQAVTAVTDVFLEHDTFSEADCDAAAANAIAYIADGVALSDESSDDQAAIMGFVHDNKAAAIAKTAF
jgi:hypothetical protein